MEKTSPAHRHKHKEVPHQISDPLLILLGLGLTSLTTVDFMIHSNGGVSDPVVRHFFYNYLGDLVNHVGNFGFAAALTIPLVFASKVLTHTNRAKDEQTFYDKTIAMGTKLMPPVLMAGVVTSEAFVSNGIFNRQFLGDSAMSALGIIMAQLATHEVMHRLGLSREDMVKNKVDGHHYLRDTPTKLDELGYLSRTPDNVNALFG